MEKCGDSWNLDQQKCTKAHKYNLAGHTRTAYRWTSALNDKDKEKDDHCYHNYHKHPPTLPSKKEQNNIIHNVFEL